MITPGFSPLLRVAVAGDWGLGENHNGTKLLIMGIYQGAFLAFQEPEFHVVTNLRDFLRPADVSLIIYTNCHFRTSEVIFHYFQDFQVYIIEQ